VPLAVSGFLLICAVGRREMVDVFLLYYCCNTRTWIHAGSPCA